MHQALYRKWRPQTFDDVCGQEHITSILKYETEHNKFSHAYLFCGSRGTGKTTCAKILAKALNCENPVNGSPCNECASCKTIDSGATTDVLEMDAASNNGVDNIRDIRDEVVYMPTSLKYRVYIVDEVHMLSGSAFNALLKTLEEPPSHVVFILATTELNKLPSTIISRCQRFDFRRIATPVLMDRLSYISEKEGIEYEKDALRIIAKMAQGGMRDAISLLELCAGTQNKVTVSSANETLGSGGRQNIENTVRAIAKGNFDAIFASVNEVVGSSKDITVFWQELISYYRDMLVMKTTASADKYLDLTEVESEQLKRTCELFTKQTLLWHCRVLDDTLIAMQKAGSGKRVVAEMALIKMSDSMLDTSMDAVLSRISKLENAVASGVIFSAEAPRATIVAEPTESVKEDTKEEGPKTQPQEAVSAESTLKVLRSWNEIAEKAAAGDFSVLPFLKLARAFIDGNGRIYVRFPNTFAKSMVEKSEAANGIVSALCIELGRQISPMDVEFGILEGDEDVTELDDLNF
ncbi:MAG: DNA polymerase III subunit gamma/tau [Ruminococcaceae bacterium]|nr:DNA polymerase III subunit gamma/tau [Oscillospiraceae bacterium]